MALDAYNARVYGSDLDAIHLAPIGTAGPTGLTAPVGYEDVGWIHEDGITEAATGSKEVIRAHQGRRVVRTLMGETGTTIAFTALETKPQTQALRYDVKESSNAAGVVTQKRGAGQKVAKRSAVIDFFDTDDTTVRERWVIPHFEIVPDGERVYSGADIAGYPFIGEIIGDYTVISTVSDEE